MAVQLNPKIYIGSYNFPDEFTDRCVGFSIRQAAPLSDVRVGTAELTLLNYDGALTPGAGGTYSSTDWFKQVVFIDMEVVGTNTLYAFMFAGIVVDFSIADDGVSSTVVLKCQDGLRFLGTGVNPGMAAQLAANANEGFTDIIDLVGTYGVQTPKFGATLEGNYDTIVVSADNANKIDGTNVTGTTNVDILRNELLPSYPSAFWAADITSGISGPITHEMVVGSTLTRPTTDSDWYVQRYEFDFTEGASAAGELPFTRLEVGFNNLELVNEVVQKTSATGNTQTVSDNSSIADFGVRTSTSSAAMNATDTAALAGANNFLQRQSSIHYAPMALVTTDTVLRQSDDDTDYALQALFDIRSCFWNPAGVTYTPTGASTATTDQVVLVGRTINATPSQTTVTLELLPAVDYQSFVLDSSTLGVLDRNRLG